jgi:insertion element IS1 protein InsB
MDYIASDYWKPYESIIPKEKHIQSKKETFMVEGYDSLFRHFLARMKRKSKCYFKINGNVSNINSFIDVLWK